MLHRHQELSPPISVPMLHRHQELSPPIRQLYEAETWLNYNSLHMTCLNCFPLFFCARLTTAPLSLTLFSSLHLPISDMLARCPHKISCTRRAL